MGQYNLSAIFTVGGCARAIPAKSTKFDCWGHCGSHGGKCSACGAGGYCCRKGFKDCPSVFVAAAHGRHHSCVKCGGAVYKEFWWKLTKIYENL